MPLTLVPFTRELLPAVQQWFRHPEVVRWLGGPDWPARALDMPPPAPDEIFRGRRVLRAHTWVALSPAGDPVAQIGGDVYDRWSRYTESASGPRTDEIEPGPAMGFAYVVSPSHWRQGLGTATLQAMFAAPELADVRIFAAGIEPENVPSTRCARAAGLLPTGKAPDWEGMIYHLLRR